MNILEVLTLLLVVFAALSYIDNHNNKKEIASHCPKQMLLQNRILLPRAIGKSIPINLSE